MDHPSSPVTLMAESNSAHEGPKKEMSLSPMGHHFLAPDDPDNPMSWPIYRKIYASAVSWCFGFVVAFGITSYTVGLTGVMARFNVSMTVAILGMSLYLIGIAFAPIHTPHLSERFGRTPVYFTTFFLFCLFTLGAGFSQNFASLAICRFFAGFFGGPSLVLIEGTFADIWSAESTNTYYAILGLSSYIGAAAGPLIGGFVFAATGWRWMQWVTLMLALAALLFGTGLPETYQREILRTRSKRHHLPLRLAKAESGVTLSEMSLVTIVDPLKMLVSEPLVICISLYVGFNFAVIFSFFISIPVVLGSVYNFTIQQVGLAFKAAIIGSLLAAFTTIVIDRIAYPRALKKSHDGMMVAIEYRLYPAMIGGIGILASLFWIGWTASPKIHWASPVIGTLLYVWGNLSVLISAISYLFDAYPPRGTLSALTAAASFRILLAAALPLCIIQDFVGITGAWALSTFGFIAAVLAVGPFVLFVFGERLRMGSRYSAGRVMGKGMARTEAEMAMGGHGMDV